MYMEVTYHVKIHLSYFPRKLYFLCFLIENTVEGKVNRDEFMRLS